MRKYFYYVKESADEERFPEGTVEARDKPHPAGEKGSEFQPHLLDMDTGERNQPATLIGLGYYDFDSEDDYQERGMDVAKEKLAEIGIIKDDTEGDT